VVVSEELLILASCLLKPMNRNSVLKEFSVRRFAVTQHEIRSVKVIFAGVEVSRKEGKEELSVICVDVMV